MRRRILPLLLGLACLVVPTAAEAQVHFDDGPAKKEYDLPLDRARGEAGAGGKGADADAAKRARAKSVAERRRLARERAAKAARERAELFGRGVSPEGGSQVPVAANTGGISPVLWSGGAALAVLLGGVVAFLVRRRRLRGSGG